jgi:Zn-dependent protease
VKRIHLFTVAGIPVEMRPEFLLVVAVLGLGDEGYALVWWIAVVTVSVVVHEFGHALAFRAFGHSSRIELTAYGGLTHGLQGNDPLPTWASVCVSIAGPVAGLVVVGAPALAVLATADLDPTAVARLDVVVWVAVGWGALNLLPLMPLDGGNATAAVLTHFWGHRGTMGARALSVAVASALGAIAWQRGFLYAAIICAYVVGDNVLVLHRMRDDHLTSALREAALLAADGHLSEGRTAAAAVGRRAHTKRMRWRATALEAWIALALGDRVAARSLVGSLPERHDHAILRTIVVPDPRSGSPDLEALVRALRDPNGRIPVSLVGVVIDDLGLTDTVADRLLIDDDQASGRALSVIAFDLHRMGRFEASARVGSRLATLGAAVGSRAIAAYNVACSLAQAGDLDGADSWLATSVEWGFSDDDAMAGDDDLAPLRSRPAYTASVERLRALRSLPPPPASLG